MKTLAIIGGTGLTEFPELDVTATHADLTTDLGAPSSPIIEAKFSTEAIKTSPLLAGIRLLFLARHGHPHAVPPHKINYRANVLALKELGTDQVLAVNAVGGIHEKSIAGHINVPHQIIDYTWGRESTYFDGEYQPLDHIDFSHPYDEAMRQNLVKALQGLNLSCGFSAFGTYAATQGPRLETAAEISRLERDGCDVVGMTGMPEAVLARELHLPYASLCLTVNPAAGKSDELITMDDIRAVLSNGMGEIKQCIEAYCIELSTS